MLTTNIAWNAEIKKKLREKCVGYLYFRAPEKCILRKKKDSGSFLEIQIRIECQNLWNKNVNPNPVHGKPLEFGIRIQTSGSNIPPKPKKYNYFEN